MTILTFTVIGDTAAAPLDVVDSCIVAMPTGLTIQIGDSPPGLDMTALGATLREISQNAAAAQGRRLHHAEWVVTADPRVVERIGMHGAEDCGPCRAAVDRALIMLIADPDRELLVGALYWTAT